MPRNPIICLLLAGLTLGLYWPVGWFDLIYFDDPLVLTDCPEVQMGLTWASVKWALTSVVIANWHPMTNLSFLLVSQFFGTTPGPHHLANAIIHAANAILLFLFLHRLTGATWRSAMATAVFAWHPLRVESVAWIMERKDVLCAFFFLLALLAWTSWVKVKNDIESGLLDTRKKLSSAPNVKHGTLNYWLALFFFALALLSKPMAVTLPFVLLLLDVWPMKRVTANISGVLKLKKLALEKLPFFMLMVLFCFVTYSVQHDYAAMTPWEKLGLAPRIANAANSYVIYPAQLFWPVNFAVIYPFPKYFDTTQTALKALLLILISLGSVMQLARRPLLAFGWFWYLGTALPIIGLVQVGEQAMADRYTYLPLIGPVIAIVWTVAEVIPGVRGWKILAATAATLILSALFIMSARQLQFWRNTVALFAHNVAVTPTNASAHFTLGLGYEHTRDTNRAIVCYRVAKMLEPADYQNRRNLANLLVKQGHCIEAEEEYNSLIIAEPLQYQNHLSLAGLLAAQGRADEANFHLNETLRLYPDCIEALNNLAWTLATSPRAELRDGNRAVALAQHACELTKFEQTIFLGTLAAAYAEAGKFEDAIATAQRSCDLATKHGETNLLQKNQELLERYRAHKTARE